MIITYWDHASGRSVHIADEEINGMFNECFDINDEGGEENE